LATTGSETLDAFLGAMEAGRRQIIEALVATARLLFPSIPEADIATRTAIQVDAWFVGLREGESEIVALQRDMIEQTRAYGVPARLALAMLQATRASFLDVALGALDAGVPGAADGVRRVMRVAQRMIDTYDEVYRKRALEVERKGRVLRELSDNAPDGMMFADREGVMTYANPALCASLGRDVTGLNLADIVDPPEMIAEVTRHAIAKGKWEGPIRLVRTDQTTKRYRMVAFRAHDAMGELIARCGILRDLTEEERAEEDRQKLRERIIAAQNETLRELSTPLMPLAEGILAMPLVGAIDEARAQQILEALLEGIGAQGAEHVIVDITGVRGVDAQVAGALVQAAQAARLLGAEVILTGIRAAVAQTLMELGADLGSMITKSTLEAGVGHAMARRGRARR
jgi:PAS domain S-box-containing protein